MDDKAIDSYSRATDRNSIDIYEFLDYNQTNDFYAYI